MPLQIVRAVNRVPFTALANTLQIPLELDDPIHCLSATMNFMQEGAALPTIAQMITQFGSALKVKYGGAEVVSLSVADNHHLLELAMPQRVAVQQTDGVGADEQYQAVTFPIPLAPFDWPLPIHPDFGLLPKVKSVTVELTYPADSAILDNRLLSIHAYSLLGKTPTRVIERVTRSITPPAIQTDNYISLPNGTGVALYDLAWFQTTAITDGLLVDAESVEEFSLELAADESYLKKVSLEATQFNLGNLSQTLSLPKESGHYAYIPTSPLGSVEHAIPLEKSARLNYRSGVADLVRFFGGVIKKI